MSLEPITCTNTSPDASDLGQVLLCLSQVHSHNGDPFKNYHGHVDLRRIRIQKLDTNLSAEYEHGQVTPEQLEAELDTSWTSAASKPGSHNLEVTLLALNTDKQSYVPGSKEFLQRIFRRYSIPGAALSSLLDNRIQFAEFRTQVDDSGMFCTAYHLGCRQWSLTWSSNSAGTVTNAILKWFDSSWAQHVGNWAAQHLSQLRNFVDQPMLIGIVGCLVALTHITEDLSKLDCEALIRERKLRASMNMGPAVRVLDYGKVSAETSWSSSQAVRDRIRLKAILALLSTAAIQRTKAEKSTGPLPASWQLTDLLVVHLVQTSESLAAQAAKLIEENSMHLSALFNLIAQRDQTASMEIAQASKDLAGEARREQNTSNDTAEASRQIAIESKRDSTSMMTIAAVTMIFLPGTFLASCFAMPLFDWSAPTSRVVNPRIWVYWTITAILTVLTVVGWAVWMRQKGRIEQRGLGKHESESQSTFNSNRRSRHGDRRSIRSNDICPSSEPGPEIMCNPWVTPSPQTSSESYGRGDPVHPSEQNVNPGRVWGSATRPSLDPIPLYMQNICPLGRSGVRTEDPNALADSSLTPYESFPFLQTATPQEIYGSYMTGFGIPSRTVFDRHPASPTEATIPAYLQKEVLQSITVLPAYQNYSFEEIKLRDYAAGRRFADFEP